MNKIEMNLSEEQLAEMCQRLYSMPKRTLASIKALAEEYGVEVSLMGARSFRQKTYFSWKERFQRIQHKIDEVAAITRSGAAQDLNEATAALLASELYDSVNDVLDTEGELDIGGLSKILQRLRTGDQRQKLLEAQLKEYQAKEDERGKAKKELAARAKAARSEGGLSDGAMEMIREAIGLL